jgi:hypothetical protein
MFICSAYKIIRRKEKPQITANVSGGGFAPFPVLLDDGKDTESILQYVIESHLRKGES